MFSLKDLWYYEVIKICFGYRIIIENKKIRLKSSESEGIKLTLRDMYQNGDDGGMMLISLTVLLIIHTRTHTTLHDSILIDTNENQGKNSRNDFLHNFSPLLKLFM